MMKRLCSFSTKQLAFFGAVRQKGALTLCLASLGLGIPARAQIITTFDAPGAGTAPGQGTFGLGMTPSQAIEGDYIDGNGAFHGFLRASNGVITTFDAPGAGAGQGTVPESINPAGAITGYYTDASGLNHGFVRSPELNLRQHMLHKHLPARTGRVLPKED